MGSVKEEATVFLLTAIPQSLALDLAWVWAKWGFFFQDHVTIFIRAEARTQVSWFLVQCAFSLDSRRNSAVEDSVLNPEHHLACLDNQWIWTSPLWCQPSILEKWCSYDPFYFRGMVWKSSETNDIKMFSEDYAVTMDKHTDDRDIILFKVLYISSFNCILWGILNWDFYLYIHI